MARVLYLQVDSGKNSGQFLIDADTRTRPVTSDGSSLTIRLGAFHFDTPKNLSGLTALNFEIRETSSDEETPFLSKNASLPIDAEIILLSAWNSRLVWNAEVDFSAEELDFTLPEGADYVDLWMIVTATYSGGVQETLGAGTLRLVATNDSGVLTGSFMLKSVYDSDDDGIVSRAAVADAVAWANVTGKPSTFTPSAHTHVKADVTDLADFAGAGGNGLVPDPISTTGKILYDNGTWAVPSVAWANITGAPSDFIPASHSHLKAEVTDLSDFAGAGGNGLVPDPVSATGKILYDNGVWATPAVAWANVTGKPATFTPSAHTHVKADVTDLSDFAGAGGNGLVPDPGTESGRYLADDGSWTPLAVFSGPGGDGLVPNPTTTTGRYLKDDGTWDNPATSATPTPKDVVVFEVIPPNVAVTVATHYVCRWTEQFDCSMVQVSFETNSDYVSLTPQLGGINLLNGLIYATPSETKRESADMNHTSFGGGAAGTARMTEDQALEVLVNSVGGYGAVEGLWLWLIGEWNFNQ